MITYFQTSHKNHLQLGKLLHQQYVMALSIKSKQQNPKIFSLLLNLNIKIRHKKPCILNENMRN
jgi:hypothetical protein